jgi:hypothetical protein
MIELCSYSSGSEPAPNSRLQQRPTRASLHRKC